VGRIYELAGPQVLTLRQIVELVLARMGRRRLLVPVPLPLVHMLATAMERVPGAPLSVGQVDLLKDDNLPAPGMPGLPELGIAPRDLQSAIAALAVRP
jgi:NADH dehydrogenase